MIAPGSVGETFSEGQLGVAWHLITGEYPPAPGGVADYTFHVAGALAAFGDVVHVWCPQSDGAVPSQPGVEVHPSLGALLPGDLLRFGKMLDATPQRRRLLIQWVPHAFGLNSVNLPFCLWVLKRAFVSKDVIELMVHEPLLMFSGSMRQRMAAIVHRVMMAALLLASSRVWVSIPYWWELIRPMALGRRVAVGWLPVPSNVPTEAGADRVAELRAAVGGAPCVGNFGSFGPGTITQLVPILDAVLERCPVATVRLIGHGAAHTRALLLSRRPADEGRILIADGLTHAEVACQIASCDVLVQPYLDGVSSRRGSYMACIALGAAIVTHAAESTEPVWRTEGAGILVDPSPDAYADAVARLLSDDVARRRLGAHARQVYGERFHIRHVVERLRQSLTQSTPAIDEALTDGVRKDGIGQCGS